VHGQEIPPDELFERQQDHGAEHGPEQGPDAAEQHHDDGLDGKQHVEGVRRLDVMHPGGIDGAGHADEDGREPEGGDFVARGGDAEGARRVLVLLDAAQAEAELGAADQNGHGHGQDHEREHGVEEQHGFEADREPQDREVEAHAAAREGLVRIDQLAQHLGHDQAGDREIVAAQMQDGGPERQGEGERRRAGRRPGREHEDAGRLQDPGRIGAEAEEGGRREGRIAREAADDVPGLRQHRVHGHRRGDPQCVIAGPKGQSGEQRRAEGEHEPGPHS
jgi:hypothetical protein